MVLRNKPYSVKLTGTLTQRFFASHKAIIEQRIEPLEQIGGHSFQTRLAIYTHAC
jgi:hypothetical protein